MGRPKLVAQDLLADLPTDIDAVPTQPLPPPKPKRTKKAQPKAKATEVEAEDALPISKLAESSKSQPSTGKRRAESQPSQSTQPKKLRSSSATTSGSKKSDVPWAPQITLEDRPIMTNESADDINVDVALTTALLLLGDLERNAGQAEEESESESEVEDEDNNDDEALVRKSKDATEAKSPRPTEQVMDLTLNEEGDEVGEVPREDVTGQLSSDLLLAERSLNKTLAEIDAELAAEKAAEVVPQESAEVQTQIALETEES
ncbi:histone transcription regulator 3 homolog [Camellia sinensis]|uniref:histone transcription regulator 3 homolog n=1 Tax=Camellia sinensis TaxID=4442 RepID=UPI001036181D|nr:histone transcription regulator 3 homolog [Camellia sinensis]